MDFTNERYVRVYTRDTTTWKLLDWRARTVLLHLLRKVDRAGILDVDDDGVDGLAASLELPLDVVRRGIEQLVTRGVVVATSVAYVLPKFLIAQEAVQSDAVRAREYRARRRSDALGITNRDGSITQSDDPSRSSRPPSLLPSLPSRTEGTRKEKGSRVRATSSPLPDGWEPPAGGETEKAIAQLPEPKRGPAIVSRFKLDARARGRTSADHDAACATYVLASPEMAVRVARGRGRLDIENNTDADYLDVGDR